MSAQDQGQRAVRDAELVRCGFYEGLRFERGGRVGQLTGDFGVGLAGLGHTCPDCGFPCLVLGHRLPRAAPRSHAPAALSHDARQVPRVIDPCPRHPAAWAKAELGNRQAVLPTRRLHPCPRYVRPINSRWVSRHEQRRIPRSHAAHASGGTGPSAGPDHLADVSHAVPRVLDGDRASGCRLDGFGQVPHGRTRAARTRGGSVLSSFEQPVVLVAAPADLCVVVPDVVGQRCSVVR